MSRLDLGVDGREGTREEKVPVTGEEAGGVGVSVGKPALMGSALSGELDFGGAPSVGMAGEVNFGG